MSDEGNNSDIYTSTFESTGGRESSLYQWTSVTETIQFVDSNTSEDTLIIQSKEESSTSTDDSVNSYLEDDFESINEDGVSSISLQSKSKESFSPCEKLTTAEINLREDFLRRKIDILQIKPDRKCEQLSTASTNLQTEKYNKQKIKLLKSKMKNLQEKDSTDSTEQQHTKPIEIGSVTNQLKNTRKLERLKIENAIFKVQKKTSSPYHQPRKCRDCRKLQSKLTEKEYIKRKTVHLKKQQFYEDLEKHLYQKDSATLIANIINSGPKPSDPPQEIWDRLLNKGKYN